MDAPLRERGFVRHGKGWVRKRPNFIDTIQAYDHVWYAASGATMYVYVGSHSLELDGALGEAPPRFPKYGRPLVWIDLRSWGPRDGSWRGSWEVRDGTDLEDVAQQAVFDIVAAGLPKIDRFVCMEDIYPGCGASRPHSSLRSGSGDPLET